MNLKEKINILSIETSCDETGVCLLSATGEYPNTEVTIHANELATQIEDHQEYGGVFPSLAKRLHAQNFPTLLKRIFASADTDPVDEIPKKKQEQIHSWLSRHPDLPDQLFSIVKEEGLPDLDAVAVTIGPGLEPALWVGINVARSLSLILDIPVLPTNHMEGHVISALVNDDITDGQTHKLKEITFPAVALLVSGGHTELVLMKDWQNYEKIGQTRDDAAGEAFDKVGRLLGLPYPAGPHVSEMASQAGDQVNKYKLPRPMMGNDNLDFSFSGLKTAAARLIKKNQPMTERERAQFARELETAIVDVLVDKTTKALAKTGAETLLVGGGVSANETLRSRLTALDTNVHISPHQLAGDNAVMIGLVAAGHYSEGVDPASKITADSRLSL